MTGWIEMADKQMNASTHPGGLVDQPPLLPGHPNHSPNPPFLGGGSSQRQHAIGQEGAAQAKAGSGCGENGRPCKTLGCFVVS